MTRYNIDGFFDAIDNVYFWRVFDNLKQDGKEFDKYQILTYNNPEILI